MATLDLPGIASMTDRGDIVEQKTVLIRDDPLTDLIPAVAAAIGIAPAADTGGS